MAFYFDKYNAYTDFYDLDSWVEIASQPSSSSLSSVDNEVVTTEVCECNTTRAAGDGGPCASIDHPT